ncbi:MAG: class I SAM-dependent methyltransferase [Myxococcota bacterium]
MNHGEILKRYHATPGMTPLSLQNWEDRAGRTSYEVIAARTVGLSRSTRLLDLGCGDGFLLEVLARRGFNDLVGVDLSAEELAAARERLGPQVKLHQAAATTMPLAPHSIGAVLSHMALMLMPTLPRVLAELARVLEPAGALIAVTNQSTEDRVYEPYRKLLHHITGKSGMQRLRMGDARIYTHDGLRELFAGSRFDTCSLNTDDFELQIRTSPKQLWTRLRLSYDVFQLSAGAQAELERRLLRAWAPLVDSEGLLTCRQKMRIFSIRVGAGLPAPRLASKIPTDAQRSTW